MEYLLNIREMVETAKTREEIEAAQFCIHKAKIYYGLLLFTCGLGVLCLILEGSLLFFLMAITLLFGAAFLYYVVSIARKDSLNQIQITLEKKLQELETSEQSETN